MKLTSEKCKELKDAELPQVHTNWDADLNFCPDCIEDAGTGDVSHCPSLSELIEACGNHGEFRLSRKSVHGQWRAFANDTSSIFADGTTPEEAVANLWLALNTKV